MDSELEFDDSIFSISQNLDIQRVGIEEVRKCKGFESVSDDEAEQIIESLYQLSLLTLKIK